MAIKKENNLDFEYNEQTTPSHLSYKQYRKKVTKKKNDDIVILFVSAFFIMMFVCLGLAKQFSPDIDVSIGNNEVVSETEGISRGLIDDRLKSIQMEDKGEKAGDEEMFDMSLDEKVVLPKDKSNQKEDDINEISAQTTNENQEIKKEETKPSAQTSETPQQAAKVVVGYYSTAEQAEVAKGILQEAGLNVTPFIRNIGGAYTIQTGSFSSRDAAQNAAAELLRNNFPARVIVE